MKFIRKVSPKLTHELSIGRIQLLFEWLEGLRSTEELPFDNFRMVAGSGSDLTSKPTWTCQDTLCELLLNRLRQPQQTEGQLTFTRSSRS